MNANKLTASTCSTFNICQSLPAEAISCLAGSQPTTEQGSGPEAEPFLPTVGFPWQGIFAPEPHTVLTELLSFLFHNLRLFPIPALSLFFFFFPQETSTPNFTSSSVSGNTQSDNVVRVLQENQVVRQGLGQTRTTPLSMNLIPYGIWGRDSPWQNVEAWLLKLSPFMTCETILIQRNALGGEKCRQFKSLCMCMEQWIQAIIGWPLLTCTEAYRKLMKNLKALNKQVKTILLSWVRVDTFRGQVINVPQTGPQTRWLRQKKFIFSESSDARSSRSRCQQAWFLLKPLS